MPAAAADIPGHRHGATTINALSRITVVGSTAFIVDGHGKTIAVDPNPYGVVVAPPTAAAAPAGASLKAGDVLVSNIGANDTGTTLVRFPAAKGPGFLFNAQADPGTSGPNAEVFDVLTGTVWVANKSGGTVQIFNRAGHVVTSITNPLFNKPWGLASNQGRRTPQRGAAGAFFVTNVGDGTIDRIDIVLGQRALTYQVTPIGQLAPAKIAVTWVPTLRVHGTTYTDVLLALEGGTNRIAAYPQSSTRAAGKDAGTTVFQGAPLNSPIGLTPNPLNHDLLVVNQNDNNVVELDLTQRRVVGLRQLDNVPVDVQSGNGSALIGVAAGADSEGNLQVFFTDDNTNTLDVLSAD
jgi:DNA-binding beta-propeller fold protein YncE